ncbi:hypothetical protein JMJ56_13880 [Belnapia sp. T18]|uniref:Methyltransferase domain-containing protein n=1 Tax=Belnapia arida TaxID=2804533 RepID=A0ABS1U5W6_9PROT|nr:hypothetical protein [Belnapia arida]MBL6079102.1 hypothetical protein [Belnapia arida]
MPEAVPPATAATPADAEAAQVLEQYRLLSGRAAPPAPAPLDAALAQRMAAAPWPFASGDGRHAGPVLAGLGFALERSRVRRGHRVLEAGASGGPLSFLMAKLGCAVTLQTDDPTEAEALRRQANEGGLPVQVAGGPLGAVSGRFDMVLSHGSLRRRLDHRGFLAHVRDVLLAPGGRLLLVGEPLAEDRPSAWGLDTAPEAADAMRRDGALALSFRPSYLLHTLAELGFDADLSSCPYSPYGNTFVAGRRRDARPATPMHPPAP